MKIALYIEDGLEQIVLTPESDVERGIVGKMHKAGSRELTILQGSFYACRSGFVRQGQTDESTIIVLRPASQPMLKTTV